MIELACFVALLAGFAAVALVPWPELLQAGGLVFALGMAIGVPAGLLYHVRLWACLRARGELPARWWLHPVGLHDRLGAADRRRVLPGFFVGGAGFVVTAVGVGLFLLGAVGSLLDVAAVGTRAALP